ncbi:MAG TPA: PASTA domain-containing protein, partial [Iamia sp.]|nr:PASTA domain-containing protein [Iamia sp.]
SGPAGAWIVEPATGRVQPVDMVEFQPVGEPIEVGQPLVGQSVDVDGTLWLLDDDGRVRSLEGRELSPARPLELGDPDQAALATVGDLAVVADPVSGRLTTSEGDSWAIDGLLGGAVLMAGQQPGPVVALVVVNGSRRSLVAVDLDAGAPLPEVVLGPDPVAAPLPVDQRIFVPTVTADGPLLRRFDLPDLAEGEAVDVPHGDDQPDATDGDLGYDAFLEGTRLWANDPRSEMAVTVGVGQESREVNKLDPSDEGESGTDAGDEDEAPTDEPPIPETPAPDPVDPGSGSEPPIPTPTPATPDPAPPSATPGPSPVLPTPPVDDTPAEVTVPDVTGRDPQTACSRLQQAGLGCAPESVEDDDRDVDVVFEQSPDAGSTVTAATAVTVRFAVRSRVVVPAVEGMTSAAATTALETAGLVADPQERTDATPRTRSTSSSRARSRRPTPRSTAAPRWPSPTSRTTPRSPSTRPRSSAGPRTRPARPCWRPASPPAERCRATPRPTTPTRAWCTPSPRPRPASTPGTRPSPPSTTHPASSGPPPSRTSTTPASTAPPSRRGATRTA